MALYSVATRIEFIYRPNHPQGKIMDQAIQTGLFEGHGQALNPADATPEWRRFALAQLFHGKKAAIDKLSDEQRDTVAQSAWVYATVRAAALAKPVLAFDSERALFGQHNLKDDIGAAIRVLQTHCLDTAAVPSPSSGQRQAGAFLPLLPDGPQVAVTP